jgi:threonylcarbamoyladenosine tRNA methylthiotransferase MtaB
VARIEGVEYILGNPEKGKIVEYLNKGRRRGGPETLVGSYETGTPLSLRAQTSFNRTRVNLKVQDGCNKRCSFCIVPMARGSSKSLPLDEVIDEIDVLVEKGFKEIVFTGIHLGAYGADLRPPTGIARLLKEVERKGYPCRFRLSSIDPDEVTDELIELLKGADSICNHLHLPLQSGDNKILKKMRRPYTRGFFKERVEKLVTSVPGMSIGLDVIAGFPGEGPEEFENTYSLIKGLPVSYLHVFPFSMRRGTPAAEYEGRVDTKTVKQRCGRLRELDVFKRENFYGGFVGSKARVLVESKRDKRTGIMKGRTRNYIPVLIENGEDRKGAREPLTGETEVRLIEASGSGMVGRL